LQSNEGIHPLFGIKAIDFALNHQVPQCLVFARAFASNDRPHLTSDPVVERAAAFFLLGLQFCIGYRQRWHALGIVLVAAGGFEAAQLLTPDRQAEVADAAVKVAGGLVGFGAGLFLRI